jgi:hypothetical protein
MRASRFSLFLLIAIGLFSCKKKTEEFSSAPLSDYIPLQVGHSITYRLDSVVFKSFGTVTEVHSYQEKHVVDALLPDGLGRPSYRIFRYLRDTSGTSPWTPVGTYFITPLTNSTEVIENNLRFMKLTLPIAEEHSWKGNEFLPDDPYSPLYNFENDDEMSDWDYTYGNLDESVVLNGKTIDHVLTVNGVDQSDNVPIVNQTGYGSIDFMQDKYAKGIGLVYQRFIMWEYQPPNGINPVGAKTGFELTRSMIDHN